MAHFIDLISRWPFLLCAHECKFFEYHQAIPVMQAKYSGFLLLNRAETKILPLLPACGHSFQEQVVITLSHVCASCLRGEEKGHNKETF